MLNIISTALAIGSFFGLGLLINPKSFVELVFLIFSSIYFRLRFFRWLETVHLDIIRIFFIHPTDFTIYKILAVGANFYTSFESKSIWEHVIIGILYNNFDQWLEFSFANLLFVNLFTPIVQIGVNDIIFRLPDVTKTVKEKYKNSVVLLTIVYFVTILIMSYKHKLII